MCKKTAFMVAVVLVTFWAEPRTRAEDNNALVPATNCVPWFYEQGTVHYGENGRTGNEHATNRMTLTCPINVHGNVSRNIKVWARDQHSLQAVECSYNVQNVTSESRTTWNLGATTGASNTIQVLSVNSLPMYTSYNHFINCSLPPMQNGLRSVIAGYLWH